MWSVYQACEAYAMDLRQKLATLPSMPGRRLAPASASAQMSPQGYAEKIAMLRRRLEEVCNRRSEPRVERYRSPKAPEPHNLSCARRETEHGVLYAVDRRYDWEHRHGNMRVDGAVYATGRAISALSLDESLAGVDPRHMLFLDTETTGLAAGTGTLAFLMGLGFFDDGAFRVEQLLLTQPGNEGPMLRRVAERLEQATALVTYNGKTFDWPLLRNRFVMNRVPVPPEPLHLDLLHCARRVFKYRLSSVRLVEVETEVLGFERLDDVDGGEIPELYWQFLRSGDGTLLEPVLRHNADDIVALAAILGHLARGIDAPSDNDDPRDCLGYAELALRQRDPRRALEQARKVADAPILSHKALSFVAKLERKVGNHVAAVELLRRAIDGDLGADARAKANSHLTLAKLYEHELKDLPLALGHAKMTVRVEGRAGRDRRVARLRHKIALARQPKTRLDNIDGLGCGDN